MISFSPMKNFRLIIALAIALLAVGTVSTQAQTKVASVDMKKLFNGYWKTKQAETLLDKDKADARKDLKDMADGIDKAQADYKALLDQAEDQAISSDARDKLKQSAADKAKEINSSKVAYEQFQRQVEASLADKSQRMSANIVGEIQKAVSDKAKLGGYAFVVNSANPEAVVYASPDNDITDSVLSQINAGAPVDVSTPASNSLDFKVSTNSP
jgi:outer membrane protein